MKKIIIFSLLILIIGVVVYTYRSDCKKKEIITSMLALRKYDSIQNIKHREAITKDSIRRWKIFALYDSIREPDHLVKMDDKACSISLDIDTSPEVFLHFHSGEKTSYYSVDSFVKSKDSLAITCDGKDSAVIWILKRDLKIKNKGVWIKYYPQTNKYYKIGTFIGINRDY